jgi:hypothetical protein
MAKSQIAIKAVLIGVAVSDMLGLLQQLPNHLRPTLRRRPILVERGAIFLGALRRNEKLLFAALELACLVFHGGIVDV